MAEIKKRLKRDGTYSYTACIRLQGFEHRTATFTRMTDAKIWGADTETQLRQGKYVKSNKEQKRTVADLIDRYIEFELPERKSDKAKYRMMLNWWKSQIGNCYLSTINNIMLAEYRDKLSMTHCKVPIGHNKYKEGKKLLSNATVNRYLASLSIVFTSGVQEYGWLEDNPLLKVKKKKEPKGRVRYLNQDEVSRLLHNCMQESYHLFLAVFIALSTGARYGEITGLKWQNVDMKNKQFHFLDTKNGEDRSAKITPMVYDELLNFSKVRNIKSDYLFASADGSHILYLRSGFKRALIKSNISDFHFHDLRHTAASNLAMNNATLIEIAVILGHKTLAMVQRYAHLTKDHTDEVLENMNEKIFENIDLSKK